jgi:hypothetical protein
MPISEIIRWQAYHPTFGMVSGEEPVVRARGYKKAILNIVRVALPVDSYWKVSLFNESGHRVGSWTIKSGRRYKHGA